MWFENIAHEAGDGHVFVSFGISDLRQMRMGS